LVGGSSPPGPTIIELLAMGEMVFIRKIFL